ncbi:MAG: hypothetical protein GWP10_20345 [Nitrospiraceae bacterium]|nr:hypothetical protein [Nitrospiraceae bacterium]
MVDIDELKRRKDVGGLIDALADEEEWVRLHAAEALGEIGEPAVEPLITALRDEHEYVRLYAAIALGETGDKRAVEPLITALRDEHEYVRGNAAEALGKIGDERGVEPLITALGDEESLVRLYAAEALGVIGDKRAVEPLIKALGDEDEYVRWSAAEALGKIGDERGVEPLITALKDEDGDVRGDAAEALGKIGDKRAIEPLITALRDEEKGVRGDAALALGEIGDKRAVEPLITALGDEEEDVRFAVAISLGKFGDERAIEPLITALRDEEKGVRGDAAEALGKIGDKRAIPALEKATSDSYEDVRKQAKEALDKIKLKVEEPEPTIILKSKSEYHGANIDFKVSIENQLDHSIADVKAALFVPQVFLLSEKEKTIGLIKPKERQTTTFAIRPTGECGDCTIEGEVTYYDTASDNHERIKIKPKSVAVKCAILKRFKTEDDAWFDLVTTLISTKETHEEIPVSAETLFSVATHALRSMNMFMLEPVRNSAPGYFSGSARYAALGAVGGMKYAAQLNVIGSEASGSRLVLEAWAEEESALVGFYHRMLDRLEEQTRVKEHSLVIGSYTHIGKNVGGDDLSNGGTKITGDVAATRSTIGGRGGEKPFSNCPHCGEALNLPKTPKFCPYCGGQLK